jgi:hypothetical protein
MCHAGALVERDLRSEFEEFVGTNTS